MKEIKAYYHLPGLFEFYEFYKVFLPLFKEHREYFYEWCDIGSIYGAPCDALWGGGRVGFGKDNAKDVKALVTKYDISPRLTFSNSLLEKEHLSDVWCNKLCELFQDSKGGIIIYSDLLLDYIKNKYNSYYFVSTTTKVITEFEGLADEINREEYRFVVPDFRLNKQYEKLAKFSDAQKDKVEFLCNECCDFGCTDRKACYENVSRKVLGEDVKDHICKSKNANEGYVFSKAMTNQGFISLEEIQNKYIPMGFSNFKIEGRSLGSALLLEFILYYMTKNEYQLKVREAIYLDHSLDLF